MALRRDCKAVFLRRGDEVAVKLHNAVGRLVGREGAFLRHFGRSAFDVGLGADVLDAFFDVGGVLVVPSM